MPRTSGSIPNLINGISQQSPAMRLPSQAEASENYSPTVTDGLTKRPPTDHLAVLAALPDDTFTHFILRDETEKYVVAIRTNGTIRIWDFAGVEKTVNNLGSAYLAGLVSAEDDLRALTLVDHTFIVNKKRTVAVGTSTEPARPFEALVNVAAGNYGKTYNIIINGSNVSFVRTPDGGAASQSPRVDTTYIASSASGKSVLLPARGSASTPQPCRTSWYARRTARSHSSPRHGKTASAATSRVCPIHPLWGRLSRTYSSTRTGSVS